mmetsp:Transcript_163232/g.523602  ORF Transcript_163232/g.523602 Transcript_163232/m.523602 type:complete len:465 (-) Transcript_163232:647-2041(-)|eukprot:CAMPEP_0203942492 /NCGR_PEP_ID=MMETSP0359-20131031/78670_1 /ASSEMBLY_ACC=CAM_ASM_000338 /TAXON_ID=268821 /ORGANISM="Scrippsiella Hangoei, Strain SHTV-5" /LENGTH=464 /DNA_ID=CAMNT_0050873213 /DNA_START=1 /DNA_END=1395 /DNA_ORIENTATION=+
MASALHAAKHWKSTLGRRPRSRLHEGAITIQNDVPVSSKLSFRHSGSLCRRRAAPDIEVAPGEKHSFDLGATSDFDYMLRVHGCAGETHVVRGASYRLLLNVEIRGGTGVEAVSLPARQKGDKLASTPGLSFCFSGSGFLCSYELGAAEYLQDQGISSNPYVRVAGTSGGAMTICAMMYGADMRTFLEPVKAKATQVRRNPAKFSTMRNSMLETLATYWKDGSAEHPAFKEGRVEICYAETSKTSAIGIDALTGAVKERRVKSFRTATDLALALLASSSTYFSGLPFVMHEEEMQLQKVADGGLVNNLPVIDENSVTLKPFTDGFDVMHFSGVTPDIAPSEFVPLSWGVLPPDEATLLHLFELGYRDMEAWVEAHLDERLGQIRASRGVAPAAEELPPVSFVCSDLGTQWHANILCSIPVSLRDQLLGRCGKPGKHAQAAICTGPSADDVSTDSVSASTTIPSQ